MTKFLSKLKELAAKSDQPEPTPEPPPPQQKSQWRHLGDRLTALWSVVRLRQWRYLLRGRDTRTLQEHPRRTKNAPHSSNLKGRKTAIPPADGLRPRVSVRDSARRERLRRTLNAIGNRRILWLGAGLGLGGVVAIGLGWWSLERSLPDTSNLPRATSVRYGTITIGSEDGVILHQLGPATHEKLKIEQIPDQLIKAFIAIEDRRFYEHRGVDFQGITRAFTTNVLSGEVSQGGSTITQQLARITFLGQERSALRKLREVALAGKIEKELNKSQILERYLNLVYLGSGAYGVADAAWVYFGKSINQLTLPEMTMLAGLPPSPSHDSPLVDPEAALQRRNLVLQQMQEVGFISAAEAEAASAAPLTTRPKRPRQLQVEAPYFVNYVQQQLPKYVSPDELEVGGLTVETTLNAEWQQAAEKTLKDAVEQNGAAQNFEQAALVAVDPRRGTVKAMVGGLDFAASKFNRVTQAHRQPGSAFKAFVYTAAIAAGLSPYRSYLDSPYRVDGYQPENYGRTHRGWVAMPDALARSVNVVAVKVLIDVGFNPAIKLAHQMGVQSELHPYYSLALGSNEVTLFELTSAFSTLAAQGIRTEPHGIRRVIDRQGRVIYDADFKPKRVLDQKSAATMTWMLSQVVTAGTGGPAQLGRPVAGKTGTSEKARDLWFIGYIPQLATGVWLGNDDDTPTGGSSGTAASTWRKFMAEAVEEMPVEKLPELPNLEGRKGSIKAEPVHPRSVSIGVWNPEAEDGSNSGTSAENDSNSSTSTDYDN